MPSEAGHNFFWGPLNMYLHVLQIIIYFMKIQSQNLFFENTPPPPLEFESDSECWLPKHHVLEYPLSTRMHRTCEIRRFHTPYRRWINRISSNCSMPFDYWIMSIMNFRRDVETILRRWSNMKKTLVLETPFVYCMYHIYPRIGNCEMPSPAAGQPSVTLLQH